MPVTSHVMFFSPPGGSKLSQRDGVESQHVPRVPGHLPPRRAAAQLHRAPGGNGQQSGHPRVAAASPRRVPRAHASSPGGCGERTELDGGEESLSTCLILSKRKAESKYRVMFSFLELPWDLSDR